MAGVLPETNSTGTRQKTLMTTRCCTATAKAQEICRWDWERDQPENTAAMARSMFTSTL